MRFQALTAALVSVLVMTGCAEMPRKAFNKEGASHVKTISVAERAGKESYSVNIVAHPGVNFGLIGGLVAAADLSSKSDTLTKSLDPEQTSVKKRMALKLVESLKGGGYVASVVPVGEKVEKDHAFNAMRTSLGTDAMVDLNVEAGYVAAGPGSDYLPFVQVGVLKTDVKTGSVLYQDTISYGYTYQHAKTVHLSSAPQYRFKNMDDLVARSVEAREGLYAGIDLIAAQIAADLQP